MAKTAADEHGGGDEGKKIWIPQQRIRGKATEEMWDDRDGETGWKDGYGLVNINR